MIAFSLLPLCVRQRVPANSPEVSEVRVSLGARSNCITENTTKFRLLKSGPTAFATSWRDANPLPGLTVTGCTVKAVVGIGHHGSEQDEHRSIPSEL